MGEFGAACGLTLFVKLFMICISCGSRFDQNEADKRDVSFNDNRYKECFACAEKEWKASLQLRYVHVKTTLSQAGVDNGTET
jgi:hypothetical protein